MKIPRLKTTLFGRDGTIFVPDWITQLAQHIYNEQKLCQKKSLAYLGQICPWIYKKGQYIYFVPFWLPLEVQKTLVISLQNKYYENGGFLKHIRVIPDYVKSHGHNFWSWKIFCPSHWKHPNRTKKQGNLFHAKLEHFLCPNYY